MSGKGIAELVCSNCGSQLEPNWPSCNNCGTPVSKISVNCIRCHLLIPNDSTFCPFCQFEQGGVVAEQIITPKQVAKVEDKVDKVPLVSHQDKITRKLITGSLKFNSQATRDTITGEKFTRLSVWLILASGLLFAITIIIINLVFDQGDDPREALRALILVSSVQILTLFSLAFITRNMLTSLEFEVGYGLSVRYFGIWAVILLIKDIFMYPTMLYVLIFEGSSGIDLVGIIYVMLFFLVISFLFVHFIVLMKSIDGLGVFLNFLLVSMITLIVYLLMVYNFTLIEGILDNLIPLN